MVDVSSIADAAAVAALRTRVYPDGVATVAGTAHWLRTTSTSARLSTWKVERDGALAGWAAASLEPWSTDAGRAECNVLVDPDRRGDGLGSALWLAVEEHLRELGATHIICRSCDDEASKSFCQRRGFRLTSTSDTLAVDPRTLPPAPPPPEGVEILPCATFADDPTPFYEADFGAMQDEPGEHDISAFSYEQWMLTTFAHPSFDPDASQTVLVNGAVAGSSLLYVDRETGRATNGGTGVLKAHRGRGLATLLKRHALAWAASTGVTYVVTENDVTNAPMLAINQRLGYQRCSSGHGWTLER